ncbi:MAG: peptide ABC transporter substrate-binding protein [Verrucomicrobiota bacterium]|nr:peptide ABC transporter substrate-binding protein [Verrucomicrobiota bacterium]
MQKQLLLKGLFATLLAFVFCTACQRKEENRSMYTLRLNLQEGDLPSLHPHDVLVYLRGISASKMLFEGLTRVDAQGKISLAGAESLEISQDRLRYSFVLRDNCWSDGSPVTAYQYERSFKEALSPTSRCLQANLLYMIKNAEAAKAGKVSIDEIGVKALDNKRLVVELAYPSPYLTELLAQPICAPLIDGMEQPKRFNGPFCVDLWERDHLIRLKPNPHFWNKRDVKLQEIDFFMISDQNANFEAYKKGDIDWLGSPLSPLSREQMNHLQNELHQHPIERSFWIYLNTEHPHLSSQKIRQALSLAINRAQITEHIFLGGDPLGKMLPVNLLPVNLFLKPKEDLEEAQRLFAQGLEEMGYTKENFPPFVISYAQQANRKEFAQYLQETWTRAFGIRIELQQQEWNALRANLSKGVFDVCAVFEAAYYKDPLEILERIGQKGPTNHSQWISPEYRKLITSAIFAENTQARLEILGKAEKMLLEEVPIIPVCSDRLLFAHSKGLKGYAFDSLGALDLSYASPE